MYIRFNEPCTQAVSNNEPKCIQYKDNYKARDKSLINSNAQGLSVNSHQQTMSMTPGELREKGENTKNHIAPWLACFLLVPVDTRHSFDITIPSYDFILYELIQTM